MLLKDLEAYINSDDRAELVKIEPKIEVSEETTDFYVTFTKETYHYYDEMSANAKELMLNPKINKKHKTNEISFFIINPFFFILYPNS